MSPVEVGKRLRLHREHQEPKMDQEKLAYLGGVSAKTVSNIECGKHSPRLSTLERLAEVLGISVSELLSALRQPVAARSSLAGS